jgi:hypothetical protein
MKINFNDLDHVLNLKRKKLIYNTEVIHTNIILEHHDFTIYLFFMCII